MQQALPLFEQPERSILSVSRLTRELRNAVESGFSSIWVEGELSNYKRHSSGHCYFTLKDQDAQIRGVMFRSNAQYVPFRPQDGMLVQINGDASVYESRGDLQIIVRTMKMAGEGALQKAFEALKRKLQDEGLFDTSRKQRLPSYPSTIGVVTSDSGAALHDILSILQRRFPCVRVLLCPVQVQGPGAADAIAHAIERFNEHSSRPDVLIVGRGGGSLEDLWAFNEEVVARAIFKSSIPIISAVGHETDFSISDFVADVRAATPSMAAELAVPDRQELTSVVSSHVSGINQCVQRSIERYRRHIQYLISSHNFKRPLDHLRQHAQQVDDLVERLHRFALVSVESKRRRLIAARGQLDLLSPDRPLERGYALVEKNGSIVRRSGELSVDDDVSLRFHDGRRAARITDVEAS